MTFNAFEVMSSNLYMWPYSLDINTHAIYTYIQIYTMRLYNQQDHRADEYGTGCSKRHERVFLFSAGFLFLISIDSVILRFASSLHVCKIEILKFSFLGCISGCSVEMWSPKSVPRRLFLASPRCSINLVLIILLVFPTYTPPHNLHWISYTTFLVRHLPGSRGGVFCFSLGL